MAGGVPRGVDDLKLRPAEGEGAVGHGQEDVRLVDHAGGLPFHRPRGQGEEVALQVEERDTHPRLGKGEGHLGPILLLKIAVVGAVVHMGVGTQNPCRRQPRLTQRTLQLLTFLQQAGVQQDAAACVQPIKGDQLAGLRHPGAAFNLPQFHGIPLLKRSPVVYRTNSFFIPSSSPSTVRGNMGNSLAIAS